MRPGDSPYFSVVIPTFNRADRILPTLRSVQDQTFSDFECLVIDDGSSDGEQLAANIATLCDRRFVYVRQENRGASSARNRGFDLARGQYIALLDSDDKFLPSKLEVVAKSAQPLKTDALIYSQMIIDRGLEKSWIRPSRGLAPGERVDEYLLCTPGTIRTSTVVVSTELARRVRFDEELPSLQDTDFAIRTANADAEILFIEAPLVIFEDTFSPNRVSRNADYAPLMEWLDRMRHNAISERAYWAGRGWQCARIASYTNRPYAFWLYLQSLLRRAFPFGHAVVVGAQVLIPYRGYQGAANMIVSVFGRQSVKGDPRADNRATT